MLVMLANNTGIRTGYLAGRFPGSVGHLYSPGAQRGPYPFIPYALDNECFGAFKNRKEWDESRWLALLEWAKISGQKPLWTLVPDVVGDRLRTLRRWDIYAPKAKRYGWPLAFAVQDGMTSPDVPKDADVVFVGGTTEWKWRTVALWCSTFQRVHVGRVNEYDKLRLCEKLGAESGDGTGWTREPNGRQERGLIAFFEERHGIRLRSEQGSLCFAETL
jgi:hypothetical protein